MGRSVSSIRQEANGIADRWARAAQAVDDEEQNGRRLGCCAKYHASDAFYGCDEPLEAAVFSALVELLKATGPVRTAEATITAETERPRTPETDPGGGRNVDL